MQIKTTLGCQHGQRPSTDTFQEKNICEANKHMKKYSSSLVIREMLIKTTLGCQLEWWSLKNLETADAGEDMEK